MTTQGAHTYNCEWFISGKNSGLYLIPDLDISEDDRYKSNGKLAITMSRTDLIKILIWLRNDPRTDISMVHNINIMICGSHSRSKLCRTIEAACIAIGNVI